MPESSEVLAVSSSAKGIQVSICWILSLPRPDMEHCIKIGKFGKRDSRVICGVKEGDKVACYVTKEVKVIAFGEVTKGFYKGRDRLFLADGLFENRFDFSAKLVQPEIELRNFVEKLALANYGSGSWGPVLRLGIAKMPKEDFLLLESFAERQK